MFLRGLSPRRARQPRGPGAHADPDEVWQMTYWVDDGESRCLPVCLNRDLQTPRDPRSRRRAGRNGALLSRINERIREGRFASGWRRTEADLPIAVLEPLARRFLPTRRAAAWLPVMFIAAGSMKAGPGCLDGVMATRTDGSDLRVRRDEAAPRPRLRLRSGAYGEGRRAAPDRVSAGHPSRFAR